MTITGPADTTMSAGHTGDCVHGGWYLLALAEELTGEITPVELGDRVLMVIREGERVRVFDARCPHRGAHLGYGGRLATAPARANANARTGTAVICPFHGKRIGLGAGAARLCVTEHQSIMAGDALFVRLGVDPANDRGFEQSIKEIEAEKRIVGVLLRPVRVPPAYVIENAFDVTHFTALHGVDRVTGFGLREEDAGAIAVDGDFWTKVPPTGTARTEALADGGLRSRFHARAFSPGLVLTELGPPEISHTVITSAVPAGPGRCVIRVALGLRPAALPALPLLVASVNRAIDQDVVVWDHLDPAAPARYDRGDLPTLAFRQFCAGFGPLE
jgi:3-ketosteroid 9alpha-monooxygenase subunit A